LVGNRSGLYNNSALFLKINLKKECLSLIKKI
jgi:hypothetical protein